MFKIILVASCCILSVATFGQVEYRDSILLKNGAGILCRVVDVTDDVFFFEQENTAIVLSASLKEVREIRWNVLDSKIPSDTTVQVSRSSPAYQQGKKDALTYYRKKHKTNYNNPYNPNNCRLKEPDYRAGYKDGASEKRASMNVFAASSVVSIVLLGGNCPGGGCRFNGTRPHQRHQRRRRIFRFGSQLNLPGRSILPHLITRSYSL